MRGGAEGASRCTGHKRGRKGHGARATTTTTTVMAGERVKLPVTNSAVPTANWSDYTQIRTYARTHIILSSGSHYLRTHIITLYIRVCVCVCKSKKKEKKTKNPYGNRTIYFNIISKGRSISVLSCVRRRGPIFPSCTRYWIEMYVTDFFFFIRLAIRLVL